MNFVLKSAYAPVGCRPIHHWTMARLLKVFGVDTFEPSVPRVTAKDIAEKLGFAPGTAYYWRSGRTPRLWEKRIRMVEQYRKAGGLTFPTYAKPRRYNLWDLWDLVKARWRRLSRTLHPDVSRKPYSEFATMCRIYLTLKQRFNDRGIG